MVPLASQAASVVPLASQPGVLDKTVDTQARAVGLALAAASPGRAKIADGTPKVIVSGDAGIREFSYSEIETISGPQSCHAGLDGDIVASAWVRMPPRAALNSPGVRLKYESLRALDSGVLRQRFQGKTVLVGQAFAGEDVFEAFHGWSSEERYGLELHAGAISALLGQGIVQPLGWLGSFILMVALGLSGSRLTQWTPGGRTWPKRAVLLATVGVCVAVAVALCISHALLVNLTYPVGAMLIGFWGAGKLARMRGPG